MFSRRKKEDKETEQGKMKRNSEVNRVLADLELNRAALEAVLSCEEEFEKAWSGRSAFERKRNKTQDVFMDSLVKRQDTLENEKAQLRNDKAQLRDKEAKLMKKEEDLTSDAKRSSLTLKPLSSYEGEFRPENIPSQNETWKFDFMERPEFGESSMCWKEQLLLSWTV